MRKIAFISTIEGNSWGGSEELWSKTALLLLREGFEVAASVKWWPETPSQIKDLQGAGCHFDYRRNDQGIAQRAVRKIAQRGGLVTQNWLDKVKPSFVVISQGDPYSGMQWAEQCRLRQIPYALIVQAAAEHWWPDDASAAYAANCYEAAAASYFVSNGNLELIRTQLATPLASAKIVRNPFNVSYDAMLPWPEENTVNLACIGRLDTFAKGQDILFGVLKSNKWQNRPIKVSVYGNGANKKTLEKLKEHYRLDNVVFAGFASDVEEVWKTHHALILPSRYEGLPLVLVEAMLCGRPAIVTDVAGNAELLEDGKTGFVAAAATVPHIDEAMEHMWTCRNDLRQMGKSAGERIREQVMRDPIAEFSKRLHQVIP